MKMFCWATAACSILFAANLYGGTGTVSSSPPIDAIATITRASNQLVTSNSRRQRFQRVSILPNEVIGIALQVPLASAGHLITAEPLDGARLLNGNQARVATDGTLLFRLQGLDHPGVCRISLHDGAVETILEFWILDTQNPSNNPETINSLGGV